MSAFFSRELPYFLELEKISRFDESTAPWTPAILATRHSLLEELDSLLAAEGEGSLGEDKRGKLGIHSSYR